MFVIEAETKVYMQKIETAGGRTCVGSCGHDEDGYALVHVEAGKHIGTDAWIDSINVDCCVREGREAWCQAGSRTDIGGRPQANFVGAEAGMGGEEIA